MLHEMTHKLMDKTGLREKELDFWSARGGRRFDWFDDYMESWYGPQPNWSQRGQWTPLEVMSRAVEYYWYQPEILAAKDPELFKFAYRLLHGLPSVPTTPVQPTITRTPRSRKYIYYKRRRT